MIGIAAYQDRPFLLLIGIGLSFASVGIVGHVTNKMDKQKPERRPISKDTINNLSIKNAEHYIDAKYISGISNFFSDTEVRIKLLPNELHISTDTRSASLPYSRITFADCVNAEDRVAMPSSEADTIVNKTYVNAIFNIRSVQVIKTYFVIMYLTEEDEEKCMIFTPPHAGNYSLFISFLEERLPSKLSKQQDHVNL